MNFNDDPEKKELATLHSSSHITHQGNLIVFIINVSKKNNKKMWQ